MRSTPSIGSACLTQSGYKAGVCRFMMYGPEWPDVSRCGMGAQARRVLSRYPNCRTGRPVRDDALRAPDQLETRPFAWCVFAAAASGKFQWSFSRERLPDRTAITGQFETFAAKAWIADNCRVQAPCSPQHCRIDERGTFLDHPALSKLVELDSIGKCAQRAPNRMRVCRNRAAGRAGLRRSVPFGTQ